MPTVPVLDGKGKKQESLDLRADVFPETVRMPLVHQAVVKELAARRAGTHDTKGRSEVSGGGRKPWRQKGTGRARAGSNTSPLWPGGGRAFGPEPRDYRTELPRKQRRAALAAALSQKAADQAVAVIESLALAAPQTRQVAALLKTMGLVDKRTLLVLGEADANVVKSCRNLRNLRTTLAHQINPYELLDCEQLLLTAGGLERVKEVFVR